MRKFSIILAVMICLFSSFVFATDDVVGIPVNELEEYEDILAPTGEELENFHSGDESIILADENVHVTGNTSELIIVAGNSVNVEADGRHMFAAGNLVELSGNSEKDAFVAGNALTISGNIGRDIYAVASKITINGTIGRNANLFASEVYIAAGSTINGDVNISSNKVTIEDGAKILGKVTYASDAKVSIPNDIQVEVKEIEKEPTTPEAPTFISKVKSFFFWTFANIVLFVLTMLILPGMFEKIKTSNKGISTYGKSLGWGIVFIIVLPIVALIIMMTAIGVSLGFVLAFVYILILIYATTLTGYLVGTTIFNGKEINKYLVGITGIAIVQLLRMLPLVGGIVSCLTTLIAFGIMKAIFEKSEDKEKAEIETKE